MFLKRAKVRAELSKVTESHPGHVWCNANFSPTRKTIYRLVAGRSLFVVYLDLK
jgi:hypothetical protein